MGDLHELLLTVEGHHLDAVGRGVLYVGLLLAGVGVDDPTGVHSERLHQLDLSLKKGGGDQEKTG